MNACFRVYRKERGAGFTSVKKTKLRIEGKKSFFYFKKGSFFSILLYLVKRGLFSLANTHKYIYTIKQIRHTKKTN